ncbi:MAG: copper homeostasis protein CutC [Planctomycetota bacterium]
MPRATDTTVRRVLEVCAGSLDDAVSATAAGADRLELCGSLELGGLTPSIGLVEQVVGKVNIPVVAMVRPRAAGFHYTEGEFECVRVDAARLVEAGVDGLVFGFLDGSGEIDRGRVKELVSLAGSKETVFHRAFDVLSDKERGIETLADLGVNRVLTSGGAPSATQGIPMLRELTRLARGRVEILPGGGISAADIGLLMQETACRSIHIGASASRFDPSTTPAAAASLCDLERLRSGAWRSVDPLKVASVRCALDGLVHQQAR